MLLDHYDTIESEICAYMPYRFKESLTSELSILLEFLRRLVHHREFSTALSEPETRDIVDMFIEGCESCWILCLEKLDIRNSERHHYCTLCMAHGSYFFEDAL